jgi:hypothetical protein
MQINIYLKDMHVRTYIERKEYIKNSYNFIKD